MDAWIALARPEGVKDATLSNRVTTKKSQPTGATIKPREHKESDEQIKTHIWMSKMGILHHHSPNGGYRDYWEASKFKRMGTSAGFPDFIIPCAKKGYHALYLEMKSKHGKLTDGQKWWRDKLVAEGCAWYEPHSSDEAISIIKDYFGIIA